MSEDEQQEAEASLAPVNARSLVLDSAYAIQRVARLVHVNIAAIKRVADELCGVFQPEEFLDGFDSAMHFVDGSPLTLQYFLVVDTLNFCFWPDKELEYEHLARGVKQALMQDAGALSAKRLAEIDGKGVRALFGWPRPVPLEEERARLLREVGCVLQACFAGQVSDLVGAAGRSAQRLVQLLAAHFPGFRDQAVYRGHQVFFYKRAQIFVADIWGAFRGRGYGAFNDISTLTMFPDYRVPVVLRSMGLISYSPQLEKQVEEGEVVIPGSEAEVELRAASVVAVDQLHGALRAAWKTNAAHGSGAVMQLHVDWFLWTHGEARRATHPAHHKTLTIFY